MLRLADVLTALDGWYPPATAEAWDAVGLSCGDPAEPLSRVLLALDCVPATIEQAVRAGAQLLITHHPLLLTGVHGVAATNPKGSMIHRLIQSGTAHFAAHTNADVAEHGVSQALADLLGLVDSQPLQPDPTPALDQLTVFVPPEHASAVLSALFEAGAGALGRYDHCGFVTDGIGSFRPLAGAQPHTGVVGELHTAPETRLSVVLPRRLRGAVLAAMRAAHPYEEVAFELSEQPQLSAATGTGRIGRLPSTMSLAEFTDLAVARLPATAWGIRAAGPPDQQVQTVAVCGGSGAAYVELARSAGADVYLTSDLKHHQVVEAVTERSAAEPALALVDAAHWATEAPWLPVVAGLLRARFGAELDVQVSDLVTDPWTIHRR